MSVLDVSTGYFSRAFNDPEKIIGDIKATMGRRRYDTLVGTGLSGSIVIPVLAHALEKNFLVVRKKNDGSHSPRLAEGKLGHRWVFVDDFIDSGATRDRVIGVVSEIAENRAFETTFAGSYLYQWQEFIAPGKKNC